MDYYDWTGRARGCVEGAVKVWPAMAVFQGQEGVPSALEAIACRRMTVKT
jgi:hypothetical protein